MNGYDPMTKFVNSKRVSDLDNADAIFDLLGVSREYDDWLRVFDEVDDLVLIHYMTLCPEVAHIRGIIVKLGETPTIVAGTFPHTPEGSWDEVAEDLNEFRHATIAYEGTILRLFFSGAKWYLSTHKKIDGMRSRWSGATFGSSWLELFGNESPSKYFLENVGTCYAFLLSDPSNRMVCHIPEKKLYHVGTFSEMNLVPASESDYIVSHPNVTINKPLSITSVEELKTVATEVDWRVATGVLVWCQGGFIKLVPDQYLEMKNVRGNEPNMRMRYLELMLTGEAHKLRSLFPEKTTYFDEIDCQYNSLVPYLHELYVYRYEEGQYLRLDREEHYILNNVSNAILQGSAFTPQVLIEMALQRSNARQLNAMIKRSLILTST